MEESWDVLEVWQAVAAWPDAPPLTGGVWDEWPARLAQGLAVCRRETVAIRAALEDDHG